MYVFCTHDVRIYTLKQKRDNVRHDHADHFAVKTTVGVNVTFLSPLHPRFESKAINE